ncbi:MAG: hypothetical protein J7K46_05620 [Bacteroidales bacterium]|nr:hypothetical protein [Bacteroidales bacterium]
MQPELTTSPLAGVFVDQELIIEMIAAWIPDNVKIYVKENPKQNIWGRSISFYKGLIQTNNVHFISKKFSSIRLINQCLAVATATGTAGWEALFRGKPVMMFGHFFYQYAPGVFVIHNNIDCKVSIKKILSGENKPDPEKMRIYLSAIDQISIFGNHQEIYQAASLINKDENLNNLSEKLFSRIRQLGFSPAPTSGFP